MKSRLALLATAFCAASGFIVDSAAAQAAAAPPAADGSMLTEVVVTARRREENLQSVPVAVTAISSETLTARGIQTSTQLQALVPGVVFTGSGADANTTFTIRGQGKDVIGPGLPSVISYFNEVPLGSWGAVLPTYDLANVQVLKGPQGTLFGRNTTGGAVLIYSKAPTREFEGYLEGTLGSYNWKDIQGAVNVPLVQDKLYLRLAGQIARRDGYTEVVGPGPDLDDIHNDSFRVSLRFDPTEDISNVTVFDSFNKDAAGQGVVPVTKSPPNLAGYKTIPAQLIGGGQALIATGVPALVAQGQGLLFSGNQINQFFNCGTSVNCDVDLQFARQLAVGPRTVFSDIPTRDKTNIWGVSNTTTVDVGAIRVKNIFGYRRTDVDVTTNIDGLSLPLLNTRTFRNDEQFTDEVQVTGNLFDSRLNWLVGAFYLNSTPAGRNGLDLQILVTPVVGSLQGLSNSFYTDKSKAAFFNLQYRLTDQLTFNGGYRYTWDEAGVCSIVTSGASRRFLPDVDTCESTAGAFVDEAKFAAPTWSVGLDYQITPEIFAYGVVRRGYRAGGINTPLLATTGTRPLSQFQTYAPQTVTDVELGLKTDWNVNGVRGRFNVAAYSGQYKRLQNQIAGLPANFDGDNNAADDPSSTALVVNAGEARVQGVEVDAALEPVEGLVLTGGAAYLHPKYTSFTVPAVFAGLAGGAPEFSNSPEWTYNLSARYHVPVQIGGADLYLNADYYHIDDYKVGVGMVPAYGVGNASIELDKIGGSDLRATLFVNNFTDETYLRNSALTGHSPGLQAFAYGEPRMWGLRLRYGF